MAAAFVSSFLSSRFSYFPIIVCVPAGSNWLCHRDMYTHTYIGSRLSAFDSKVRTSDVVSVCLTIRELQSNQFRYKVRHQAKFTGIL